MLKNFRCYQMALELHRDMKKLQVGASLKDQVTRASESICLNLAEGSGRFSKADKRRFYTYAFGSLREVQSAMDLAEAENSQRERADQLAGLIFKLIKSTS